MADEVTPAQVQAALRARSPDRTPEQYANATARVIFNLETEGPVHELDRLFLGGPDEDRPDADILIDRTLLAIGERNRARRAS